MPGKGQGRRQRDKRRAANATAPQIQQPTPSDKVGEGDATLDAPKSIAKQENQIIRRMASFDRGVWPISESHIKAAIGVCIKNMAHHDGRVRNGAIKAMISMMGQNIAINSKDKDDQPAANVTNNTINVLIRQALPSLRGLGLEDLAKLEEAVEGAEIIEPEGA